MFLVAKHNKTPVHLITPPNTCHLISTYTAAALCSPFTLSFIRAASLMHLASAAAVDHPCSFIAGAAKQGTGVMCSHLFCYSG